MINQFRAKRLIKAYTDDSEDKKQVSNLSKLAKRMMPEDSNKKSLTAI